ncbi:MAG: hypothetical protein KDE27_22160 [Planctomycetes bacterium]|nr:hypothetical protein [Planctomycetota bacterium]
MSESPRRRLSWRKKLLFALVPLVALFVAAEIFARSYRAKKGSPFSTGSYRDQRIDLIRRGYPAAHDPLLGYVPRPGFASDDNRWHAMVTIDARAIRTNGAPRPPGERFVVAAGDSFTFGDQVGDHETWPAQLEQLLQRPVLNGGVFGYSLAQTVLRAERLVESHPTERLVLSFIPDDIKRCEQSRRFTEIPWFDLVDGELALRGVPVPDSAVDNDLDRQYLRRLLGHSAALDMLFWNTVPNWWVSEQREIWVHPPGTGLTIGKKLFERLGRFCAERQLPWLVVLQGHWSADESHGAAELLAHAAACGAEVLDLQTAFLALADEDKSLWYKYFRGHMTAAGNAWVAAGIAARLR